MTLGWNCQEITGRNPKHGSEFVEHIDAGVTQFTLKFADVCAINACIRS